MVTLKKITVLFFVAYIASFAFGQELTQDEDVTELDLIEAEIEKKDAWESSADLSEKIDKSKSFLFKKDAELVDDLVTLENWSQLAIIHPRYQPKHGRFQAFLGAGASLNNPWFLETAASFRGLYHFSDLVGVELGYFTFSGSYTLMTKELEANLNIQATSLIKSQSYLGTHLYFAPIYGKMSWFNRQIIPYDVYFTLGLGQTQVQSFVTQTVPTLHVGAGQIFAITRNLGVRWDVAINLFFAQSPVQVEKTQTQMVLMSLGLSYFFPEVSNR